MNDKETIEQLLGIIEDLHRVYSIELTADQNLVILEAETKVK